MSRILIREGAYPKVSGHFFKAVVQAVLIFGADMSVVTPRMELSLNIFHQRVTIRITERQTRRRGDRSLDYPPLAAEMTEAGFEDIRTYFTRRQNTVAYYIAM